VEAQRSLIAELEGAIASGSSDKRVDTLRRVTDLFMVGANNFSDSQVGLFDDVISKLAEQIETKARAELASRLAPVKNAPTEIVRRLARDESIEVAGPVLTHSNRLTEADLLACVQSNNQDRMLAISKRAAISEAVSDELVTRGGQAVLRSVARNEGARFSSAGFGKLVDKSANDDELAVSVGTRKDIPKEQFHALVAKASDAVFQKLAASNPAAAAQVKRVLSDITGQAGAAKPRPSYDYINAKELFELTRQAGKPMDMAVREFAAGGKFEETVVALASLCHLPIDAVENIMVDKRIDNDLVLILGKAAGLTWLSARAILQLRCAETGLTQQMIDVARQHFDKLQAATAQRVVRFYQVRHGPGGKPQ
jgi:uncharacterized protein (DUF2336 family)